MEDLLLCEYLTVATPGSLVRTEKCWFLVTWLYDSIYLGLNFSAKSKNNEQILWV
jgi:hypothetical protein